jgi:hypothetical protein
VFFQPPRGGWHKLAGQKKDRKKDGVEKKEMTFRQVTKEEKGPNIAVRSPIAEKRRRESEEKEKVKVGF